LLAQNERTEAVLTIIQAALDHTMPARDLLKSLSILGEEE
jgi:hypothetical protein